MTRLCQGVFFAGFGGRSERKPDKVPSQANGSATEPRRLNSLRLSPCHFNALRYSFSQLRERLSFRICTLGMVFT